MCVRASVNLHDAFRVLRSASGALGTVSRDLTIGRREAGGSKIARAILMLDKDPAPLSDYRPRSVRADLANSCFKLATNSPPDRLGACRRVPG